MTRADRRPTYLFVLCPAFSGSTILYRLLGSSPHASTLAGHGNWAGEGQFVPSVRSIMRRQPHHDPRIGGWEDPEVTMPWDRIRREWEKCWDMTKPVLVEKSPPNLLRAEAIHQHFSRFGEVFFIGMIRGPYYVRQRPELRLAEVRHQKRNFETLPNLFWTSYEALCRNPRGIADRLIEFLPHLGSLHLPEAGEGPEAEPRSGPIANRNRATPSLVLGRNRVLGEHRELLEFFGYELLTPGNEAWNEEPWLPEIRLRLALDAPVQEVYRAWTEPKALARWWGDPPIDLEVGGAYSLAPYTGADEDIVRMSDRFLEIERNRRLRFTWESNRLDYVLDDAIVEVDLVPTNEGGSEVLLNSLQVSRSWYGENERFWRFKLEALARVLSQMPP